MFGRYHNHESFLRHFQDRVMVFRVFREIWPEEFAKLAITPASPLPDRVRVYSELHDLLGAKIPLEEFEPRIVIDNEGEEALEDDFIERLPIFPQGRDYDEISVRYFDLVERIIMAIRDPDYDDLVARALVREKVALEALTAEGVGRVCADAPAPLCYLHDAWAICYQQTGNQWLDISSEMYWQCEPAEWNVSLVRHLIDEWADAQVIVDNAKQCEQWLRADLRRVRQVEVLLKEAAGMQRARVRTDGRITVPLVDSLTFLDEVYDDEEEY